MQIQVRSIIANIWMGCVFALGVLAAQAATHYLVPVNPAAANPYTSWETAGTSVIDVVKAAMTNATVPRTVLATNGIYVLTNNVIITNGVALRSVNGRTVTVFNGNALYNFRLESGNNTLDGLTITNCFSDAGGGGIRLGILGSGAPIPTGGGTVTNCLVTGCKNDSTVSGFFSGGGIQITGTGVVANCVIHGNLATNMGGYGGGIHLFTKSDSIIRNCIIERNTAARDYGGGICIDSAAVVENCLIADNVITGRVSAYGAGISISTTNVFVANCTIVGNLAIGTGGGGNGGGLYFANFSDPAHTNTIVNCVIVSNHSGTWDSLYGNVNDGGSSGSKHKYAFGYSCIHSQTSNSWQFALGQQGNTTNDPAFLDYQEGNYRFNRFSPCYNSGTNQTDWMNGAVDLDRHPRILHGRVDMGAYELFIPSGTMFTIK